MTGIRRLPFATRNGLVEIDVRAPKDGEIVRLSTHEMGVEGRYDYYAFDGRTWVSHGFRSDVAPTVDMHVAAEGEKMRSPPYGGLQVRGSVEARARNMLVLDDLVLESCIGPILLTQWSGKGAPRFSYEDARQPVLMQGMSYGNPSGLLVAHDMEATRALVAEIMPEMGIPRYGSTKHADAPNDPLAVLGADMAMWAVIARYGRLPADEWSSAAVEATLAARRTMEDRWPEKRLDWRRSSFAVGAACRQDVNLGLYVEKERDPSRLAQGLHHMIDALSATNDPMLPLLRLASIRIDKELGRRMDAAMSAALLP